MAELTATGPTPAASCCSTEAQPTWCEPSDTASCRDYHAFVGSDVDDAVGDDDVDAGGRERDVLRAEVQPTRRVHEHASSAVIRARKPEQAADCGC